LFFTPASTFFFLWLQLFLLSFFFFGFNFFFSAFFSLASTFSSQLFFLQLQLFFFSFNFLLNFLLLLLLALTFVRNLGPLFMAAKSLTAFAQVVEGHLNDGQHSRNDWKTRPLASAVISGNVCIANFAASEKLMRLGLAGPRIGVLNLRDGASIDHVDVDNSLSVRDSMQVDQGDFDAFVRVAAAKIAAMSRAHDVVVVSCWAGVNRASSAVLAWLMTHQNLSFAAALKRLTQAKAKAAKQFRCKNRYQSDTGPTQHLYSWPTLCGAGSRKLKGALKTLGQSLRKPHSASRRPSRRPKPSSASWANDPLLPPALPQARRVRAPRYRRPLQAWLP
jgi:hypothetical protein